MSLIDLYINDSGTIRRIGDNCHDQLTIDEDGRLHYYNLQNGDGCTLGEEREHDECFYEFVSNVDEYGYNCDPRQADTPQNERSRTMKIGDEVYVHGFIDEIRNDVIIIRNEGGYFGTVPSEVVEKEETSQNLTKPNKSDLISRQAAIDAEDSK